MKASINSPDKKYITASEKIKLIGSLDGTFPDFGHHQEGEMGGLWMHPIKLLDGFWLRFHDCDADNVNTWTTADRVENYPHKTEFYYGSGLGHTQVSIKRTQIAPESARGLIVRYQFTSHAAEPRSIKTEFLVRTDMRPVWLSEEGGIYAGRDAAFWDQRENVFVCTTEGNSWFTTVSASVSPSTADCGDYYASEVTKGDGIGLRFFHEFAVNPGADYILEFYISGSTDSKADCLEQNVRLRSGADFEKEKEAHYSKLLDRSALSVSSPRFEEIFDWIKVNNDWLIVDAGKYGRGFAAGMPEYPWWFGCDNCYALQGVLALGDFKLARDTLALVLDYSEKLNGNGRILHEVTTFGVLSNPGNTQETAHFIVILWKYYQWTGDRTLLEKAFPYITKSVEWLRAQDSDGSLFPLGYGIMEVQGLNSALIDTAVYTCEAYACYADICALLEKGYEQEYRSLHEQLKQAINENFWDESLGLYCDVYADYETVSKNLKDIFGMDTASPVSDIHRGTLGVKELTRLQEQLKANQRDKGKKDGWLINHNWVIDTPMEAGIARSDKAAAALETMMGPDYVGPSGVYLDRTGDRRIMTISTGSLAVAQARYGCADRALHLIELMFSTFSRSTPGAISEMSPDYGCFVQAWTCYAAAVPVVQYFFGIQPDAASNRIVLDPCMPAAWPKASLRNVQVLDGQISIFYDSDTGLIKVENTSSYPVFLKKQIRAISDKQFTFTI